MVSVTRRAEVAQALRGAGAAGVSGEELARRLGVTRVAVNKHVAALRDLGYGIESRPHVGYRLLAAPDACIPEEVGPLLADPLWVACTGGMETASTNEDAKRLAASGAPEGAAVVAARQSAGRGRLGRAWRSPSGGAYVSAVLRPPLPPSRLAPLSLVVALGAARALGSFGVPVALKWPNDLLAGGRKLGGILLEMAAEADRVEWVVVGCGVNVTGAPHEPAAFVREWAPGAGVAEVAAAVLDGVAAAYREFVHEGFGAQRDEYASRSSLGGRDVRVSDATGAVVAEGTVTGIAEDGALLVAGAGGVRAVHAGEVTLRR